MNDASKTEDLIVVFLLFLFVLPGLVFAVWNDARTKDLCDEMVDRGVRDHGLGLHDSRYRFQSRTGLPISTYFSAFKIQWMMQEVIVKIFTFYLLFCIFFSRKEAPQFFPFFSPCCFYVPHTRSVSPSRSFFVFLTAFIRLNFSYVTSCCFLLINVLFECRKNCRLIVFGKKISL